MRLMNGTGSMAIDARVATIAQAPGNLGADFDKWGGTMTSCVGGHLLYGPFTAPAWAAGDPLHVVLDSSQDWRDRLCFVQARLNITGQDIRPGTEASTLILNQRRVAGALLYVMQTEFYTAGGHDGLEASPRGGANLYNYSEFVEISTDTILTSIRLYADKDTGVLTLYSKMNAVATGTLMIMASEQTGKIIAVP